MPVDPKNRLNDLDSRQWLQFQKSWFQVSENTIEEFFRFFTKQKRADGQISRIGILPEHFDRLATAVRACERQPSMIDDSIENGAVDYVLVDWRDEKDTIESYNGKGSARLAKIHAAARALRRDAYFTFFMRNAGNNATLLPLAWHFSRQVAGIVSPKDEKIACEPPAQLGKVSGWQTEQNFFYCLTFRKEHDVPEIVPSFQPLQISHPTDHSPEKTTHRRPAWNVVKPPPREKGVLLHPAKFPEPMIAQFIEDFSEPGELVLDPMAGTGSALLAARRTGRRCAGIELNPTFVEIIRQRLQQDDMFNTGVMNALICGDATSEVPYRALPPMIDYVVTSPPYWDMLRMKGAETQQKRRDAGLPVFYSDQAQDLGNLSDYEDFLNMLIKAYRLVVDRLKPGGFMTVIVKNVKKKGKVYPLAWDIAFALAPFMELRHEQIWCQDDQKLAPFGYRYAWVSNTFHHYCLHFRKPSR